MAAGDSIISICNTALTLIGADPITSLTDDNVRANNCLLFYDPTRREMLEELAWNFARARAQLAASAKQPPFGLETAFVLPSDFLCFNDVDEDEDDDTNWTIEMVNGQLCVLTDEADAGGVMNIKYTFDQQDPTKMSALFVRALAGDLGLKLCTPLNRNSAEKARAQSYKDDALAKAKTRSSQQNSPREWDEDVLLRSRR